MLESGQSLQSAWNVLQSTEFKHPVARPLRQLEDLAIRLSGCKNLQSLAGLDDALGQLANLNRLELHLQSCELLQNFIELGRNLGRLVNLTSLDCCLGGCPRLVDADVRELGKGIRNLTKLNQLKVDVSGAKRVFYLTELGRSIRFLRDLRHLEMDVSLCTNLSDVSTLGNSMRMLLMETANFQPNSGSVFALKLEKSGVRINREKVSGYDEPMVHLACSLFPVQCIRWGMGTRPLDVRSV